MEGSSRWSRRRLIRFAAAGAAAAAGGWALAACGPAAKGGAAAPQPGNAKVVLRWAPWRVGWGSSWDTVFLTAIEPFLHANPGVDVKIDIGGSNSSNDGALIPEIIAGTAPDVFSGYGPTKMIEGGYTLDLSSYLRSGNVDTSVFDQGEYVKFVRGGVWALPAELSTSAVAVNEGMLDEIGLAYPDPQWDYQSAASLWTKVRATSGPGSKTRAGFIYWGQKASWQPGDFYLRGWGASAASANFAATSGLDSANALKFAQWWFPLAQSGAIHWTGGGAPPWPAQVACGFAGSWTLPNLAQQSSTKWDFWPQPAWPTGTSAYAGNDYYAVASTTKNPKEAAALIIWLATDVTWQRALMQLQLVVPPNRQLWKEWETTVKAIAPPLAGKNLAAFTDAALQNRAFNHPAFAYDSDAAYQIIGRYTPKMANGTLDPVKGYTEAAAAINNFEAGAAAEAKAANQTTQLLKGASGGQAVTFPKPATAGMGLPAIAPPKGYIQDKSGVWTLVGDGSDVWGTSDNCTFAGIPWTSSQGSFVCRVTGMANVDCPSLSVWAKFGLMARGDLSDDAPFVLMCASGANGVFTDVRLSAGQGASQQSSKPTNKTGLIGSSNLTKSVKQKASNYLLKSVWLKLERNGVQWQPYTSFDGTTWTKAGTPDSPLMAGCWVGIFCTAHNSDFNGKGTVRGTFDKLSFQPSKQVQLGVPGQA